MDRWFEGEELLLPDSNDADSACLCMPCVYTERVWWNGSACSAPVSSLPLHIARSSGFACVGFATRPSGAVKPEVELAAYIVLPHRKSGRLVSRSVLPKKVEREVARALKIERGVLSTPRCGLFPP